VTFFENTGQEASRCAGECLKGRMKSNVQSNSGQASTDLDITISESEYCGSGHINRGERPIADIIS
jgi:hypothetical protein